MHNDGFVSCIANVLYYMAIVYGDDMNIEREVVFFWRSVICHQVVC